MTGPSSIGRTTTWPAIYDAIAADRNDPDAWTVLGARVRYWAQRDPWHFDEDEVDDIVQDTSLLVYLAFDLAQGRETFEGFVRGCYYTCRNRARTRKRRENLQRDVDEAGPMPAREPIRPASDELDALRACFDELPEVDQRIVWLCAYLGYPPTQVATLLDRTANDVRVRLHRALRKLRACIQKRLGLPDTREEPA